VIDLRSQQVVEHIHGGGEEHTLIGLTGAPGNDFRQEGFADARIADKDGARSPSENSCPVSVNSLENI
jgi:hypothetical protein